MTSKIKIIAIAGSLRRASLNHAALRAAQALVPADAELTIHDIAALPFYNQDLEAAGPPAAVLELRQSIHAADALLIATPEYNYSIPGVLKNAIDWASRPLAASALNGKPAALLGASVGVYGTVRAQLHLRQILTATNTYVMLKPDLLIARAGEKFDSDGNLTDEPTREQLRALLAALVAWTRRLQPPHI
jgi:chromate reductase